ncbi:hypothetical protein JNB11_07035 [Kocuria palustris]|nr:hypothetical protein [Kocuria palustris]
MPKAKQRITKNLPPPAGYDKIKPTLDSLLAKLKDAQTSTLATTTTTKLTWPIIKLNHQISRFVYDMFYQRKAISKDLYDWLLLQPYTNAELIAKWKKQGYEKLCCINCIQTSSTNHGNACVCRVTRKTLEKNGEADREVECITCGCTGCASTD